MRRLNRFKPSRKKRKSAISSVSNSLLLANFKEYTRDRVLSLFPVDFWQAEIVPKTTANGNR
ncbi:hypothetical protein MAQA_10201 [Listeria aquatica FSL S10-1188]|uniref:Uncharacterized protein n=1 Tax=Listeria aquatica FSL S10-1188 TaxID=1265818 RepID=W7AXZ4_9LIST|nr:hypothetical protein MAQA_10201 [Listeria aquatica FSL S10-1188]